MKGKYYKLKFIEQLKEAPFFSYAAKKAGVARATIYRWYNGDKEFKEAVDSALTDGRSQLGDLAEMKLIEKIKEKDLGAIKFYLQNNSPRYRPKLPIYPSPGKRHLKAGEKCEVCDQEKSEPTHGELLDEDTMEIMRKTVAAWDEAKIDYRTLGLDFNDVLRLHKKATLKNEAFDISKVKKLEPKTDNSES